MVIPIDGYQQGNVKPGHFSGNPPGLPAGSVRATPSSDRHRNSESSGISMPSSQLVPVDLVDDREPWERQPAERIPYYRWFQIYLELDTSRKERSIKEAWRQANRSTSVGVTIFGHVAKVWRWIERAEAWDEFVFRTKRNEYLKTIELMSARQARRGVITASVGAAIIRAFAEKFRETKTALGLDELRKLLRPALEALEIGQREERLARGFQRSITQPPVEGEDAFSAVLDSLDLESSPEVDRAFNQLESVLVERVRITRTRQSQPKLPPGTIIDGESRELD